MPKIINLPRYVAQNWKAELKNTIWIEIWEPNEPQTMIRNEFLDSCPKLSLPIWDIAEPFINENNKMVYPNHRNDAKNICKFILEHPQSNIIVNCAAGISRSGAVAKFCEDKLGYKWLEIGKRHADPNKSLYKSLHMVYDVYFLREISKHHLTDATFYLESRYGTQ